MKKVVAGIILGFLSMTTAQAAEPKIVANYKDWSVYKLDLQGDVVCYAVTKPTDISPRSVNHGDVFFMVSSWKSGVAKSQPSFLAGYPLREAPEPLIRIGSDKWEMYTSEDEGFIHRASDEKRLVSSMKRGSDMRISAVSARGTATSYNFSLLGVTDSLNRMERECR